MTQSNAPRTVTLIVCPVCGRTDRYASLKEGGKHYANGKGCPGEPFRATYELRIENE